MRRVESRQESVLDDATSLASILRVRTQISILWAVKDQKIDNWSRMEKKYLSLKEAAENLTIKMTTME